MAGITELKYVRENDRFLIDQDEKEKREREKKRSNDAGIYFSCH